MYISFLSWQWCCPATIDSSEALSSTCPTEHVYLLVGKTSSYVLMSVRYTVKPCIKPHLIK